MRPIERSVDMNHVLNGTGWGELPTEKFELDIPDITPEKALKKDYIHLSDDVLRVSGTANKRRSQRRRQQSKRNYRFGWLVIIVPFAVLHAAANLAEMIC